MLIEVSAVPVGQPGLAGALRLLTCWGPPGTTATIRTAESILTAAGQAVQCALLAASTWLLVPTAAAGPGSRAAGQTAGTGLSGAGVHAGGHSQHHGTDDDNNVDELLALLQLADVAACYKDNTLALAGRLVANSHADFILGGGQQVGHRIGVDTGADIDGVLLRGVVAAHQQRVPDLSRLCHCRRCKPLQGDAVDRLLGNTHLHMGAWLNWGGSGPARLRGKGW